MRTKIRKGWKACWRGPEETLWPAARTGRTQGEVQYKLGEWTYRPGTDDYLCGPLAVFDRYEHARHFMLEHNYFYRLAVFSCLYEPSNDEDLWCFCGSFDPLCCLPTGTRLANRVKILREEP